MNFNENDLWRDKTKLLNLRFSKLHSAKVLLKLEFDTEDQVLFPIFFYILIVVFVTIDGGKTKSTPSPTDLDCTVRLDCSLTIMCIVHLQ